MTSGARTSVPAWFWIVAVLAVLWEAVGCYFYLMQVQMGPAELAALPKAQGDLFAAMPTWQWAAFAVAVWIGLAGALALLLRSRWATLLFAISLAAALVQYGYTFVATPILSAVPVGEAIGLPAAVIAIGLILVWLSAHAARRGWLTRA